MDRGHELARVLAVGPSHVDRHARGLDLQGRAVDAVHEARELGFESTVQVPRLGVESMHEPDVELGTVAADEMDLGGQPRQDRQVA